MTATYSSNLNRAAAISGPSDALGSPAVANPSLGVAETNQSYLANTWAGREVIYTLIGLAATGFAYLMLSLDVQSVLAERLRAGYLWPIVEQICFVLIIYFIIYGNLVYHFARLGHWRRQGRHRPASRAEIEAIYASLAGVTRTRA
jgi:hypothetical protein